ncbi:MAG TPA: response regulator [Thermodesulfobacteriota bacterium]|nr:response regulator [Thermodesulfobacteriota bacterium]
MGAITRGISNDVKLFLEVEKTILSKRNLQIFTASSGHDAIDIHKRERVDLILCDLYMPGMNGDELCRTIRSDGTLKNASIVMVTTSTLEEDIERCRKAGANDYIAKPINPTELLKKLSTYIGVAMRANTRVFVRLRVEGTAGDSSKLFIGTTLNISSSGSLIETGHIFTLGDTLSFSLAIPDRAAQIYAKGEVVRKAGGAQPKMNYYCINLIDIKEEDKQAIEAYAKQHPEAVI